MTNLGDVVLFSAAIPGQGGVHHINEQWPRYWINIFENNDYQVFDIIRPLIWNNPRVDWWYSQNTLLFIKRSCIKRYPLLEYNFLFKKDYIVIHSRYFKKRLDK